MAALEQLDALRSVYQDYLDGYTQRIIDNGPFHGLQKFLLGNMPANDRKADSAFFQAVEQAVSGLLDALTEEDGPIAAQAVRFMILEADGTDLPSNLMISAVQAQAIPLVAHLSDADRLDILAAYRARYPKKRMLSPRQRELMAELEK